jgi:hypothetical protein
LGLLPAALTTAGNSIFFAIGFTFTALLIS